MTPFNLLQYPSLASRRRRFHSRWTLAAGLLVGSGVATGLTWQVQDKRLQLVQEAALLQSQVNQVQNQLAANKARLAQQSQWEQQAAHVQALSAQSKGWEALHQALMHEAGPHSVQLLRLQLDSQTLELHGQAKDVQRMAHTRERLSLSLAATSRDAAWTLVSLVSAPEPEGVKSQIPVEFVWQTHWPQVGSGPPSAPLRNSSPTESRQERP